MREEAAGDFDPKEGAVGVLDEEGAVVFLDPVGAEGEGAGGADGGECVLGEEDEVACECEL